MLAAINEISWVGLLLVTIFNFILGGFYFGIVVAKKYMISMGRELEPKQKTSGLMIAGPAVCGLLISITSAIFINLMNLKTFTDAFFFGTIVGFGYLIPMIMTIAINPNFPRPFLYTAINAPYFFASSLLTTGILVSFR